MKKKTIFAVFTMALLVMTACTGGKKEYPESPHMKTDNELPPIKKMTTYLGEDNPVSREVFYYGMDGKLKKIVSENPQTGEMRGYSEYEYNEYGDVVKRTSCDPDGTVQYTDEYMYDYTEDSKTKYTVVDGQKDPYPEKFEYDSEGNLISYTKSQSSKSLDSKYEWEYDSKNNLVKETCTYTNGTKWTHEYNADGVIIKDVHYDENGQIDMEMEHDYEPDNPNARSLIEDTYEYDSRGNVIKMTYSNPMASSFTHIVYEY